MRKRKRHIGSLFRTSGWTDAGQGWEGKDDQRRASGGEAKRRIVVLRRPLTGEIIVTGEDDDGQQLLAFVEEDRKADRGITRNEYAVLVTNTVYETLSLGQLYRDQADTENTFDELKNQ